MKITKNLLLVTLLALMAGAQLIHAGSHTWSGVVNGLWSNAGNWSAGGAPVNGESPLDLTFPVSATRYNSTNDVTGLQVDTLTLAGTGYILYAAVGKTLTLKGTATNIVCSGWNTLDTSLGLILSNTNFINVATNQILTINGPISGSGSLGKVGVGQLNFYGTPANTYAGATYVLQGQLYLQRGLSFNNPAIAVPGPLVVGPPSNATPYPYVSIIYPEQIASNAPVSVRYDGTIYLVDCIQTIGALTMTRGYLGGSSLARCKLNGDVTVDATKDSSVLSGPISLGGMTRTFNISGGNYDLNIFGNIIDGGNNAGIIKTGVGSLRLTASNSYAGPTVVKDGTLQIENSWSLGSTTGGTIITNTGILRFFGGFAVGAEPLTLSGYGYGYFSVYADFNTNSWAGPVVLASDTAIEPGFASCVLTFTGPISGPGTLKKVGGGILAFSGTAANTYTNVTYVNDGKLQLNKTNANAITGPLVIGDDLGGAYSDIVQLLQPNQIADSAAVTVKGSGLFDMFNNNETIGSLAGDGGVSLVLATLTTGGDNSDTTFNGVIGGIGFSPLIKNGTGTFTLNGTNTCSGTSTVNFGKLVVNGVLPGFLQMNFLSSLGGIGTVGNVTATLAHIAPGNSVGKINTGNLSLNNGSSSLDVQINGTAPGTGYDQVAVAGTVSLSTPTLNLTLGFPGAIANKYVIISNDGNKDAVTGNFNNLLEGATFTNNGSLFSISYKGGDGNDVELTQLSVNAPLKLTSLLKLGNGQMQLNGSGFPDTTYTIQACTNLVTTNWLNLGTVQADLNGSFNFTDTNAPSFKQRFYRFTAP